MAYFAEINSENLVTNVVVGESDNLPPLKVNSVRWIETFEDGTNGVFAGPGHTWNDEHQIFCEPQFYSSWVLNTTTGKYEPPTDYPSSLIANADITWDEDNLKWKSTKLIDDSITEDTDTMLDTPEIKFWNPETSSWED